MTGDATISEVFPADDVAARFVISMAMAKNDLDLGLADLMRAVVEDSPDFGYRLRLVTGHLLEALQAFNDYTSKEADTRALIKKIPAESEANLKVMRGTLQRAGFDAVEHVRNKTFHYPRPDTRYSPTSDAELEAMMGAAGHKRATIKYRSDTDSAFWEFADTLVLDIAFEKHAPDKADHFKQMEAVRDGAIAFVNWVDLLVMTYFKESEVTFGEIESTAGA
ncbi:MAG: hypothetical protein HYX29_11700 [Solirubrobacterales bacterium]|nr:hypothetical protein [Solirubrobacterales bacterium]